MVYSCAKFINSFKIILCRVNLCINYLENNIQSLFYYCYCQKILWIFSGVMATRVSCEDELRNLLSLTLKPPKNVHSELLVSEATFYRAPSWLRDLFHVDENEESEPATKVAESVNDREENAGSIVVTEADPEAELIEEGGGEENVVGFEIEDKKENFDTIITEDGKENVVAVETEEDDENTDAIGTEADVDQDILNAFGEEVEVGNDHLNAIDRKNEDLMVRNSNEKQNIEDDELISKLLSEEEARMDLNIPEEDQDYELLLAMHEQKVVLYPYSFNCPICFDDCKEYEGIILKECLHFFCRDCIINSINFSEEVEVKCPFRNDEYTCNSSISEHEIEGLLLPEDYDTRLKKTLQFAEAKTEYSFHCKKADCPGWCIVEGGIDVFICTVCSSQNCISCKAIHPAYTCQEYQDSLIYSEGSIENVKRSETLLQSMVNQGTAMKCPKCSAYVQKVYGCDFLQCGVCKMGLCWATKGPRWGPNGSGDNTGGCGCKINGRLCHRSCNNCH